MIPFPFRADGYDSIQEGIEFLTNVIPAYDDSEQRVQLRSKPRRSIEYTAICDEREAAHADLLLYGNQHDLFGVGLWQYAERLTAAASSGATSFSASTVDVPWLAGDTVFLYADPFTWNALLLSSTTTTTIATSQPSTRAWPIGTIVVPMRAGRVAASVPYTHAARDIRELRIRFELEPAL